MCVLVIMLPDLVALNLVFSSSQLTLEQINPLQLWPVSIFIADPRTICTTFASSPPISSVLPLRIGVILIPSPATGKLLSKS